MCNLCESCIYEEKEYLEALEKAKANNPGLFAQQEQVNKRKQKHQKITKLFDVITLSIAIIGYIIATYILFFLPSYFDVAMLIFIIFIIIATLVGVITFNNDAAFWNEISRIEYWLYKQQKLEFSKVGYELP